MGISYTISQDQDFLTKGFVKTIVSMEIPALYLINAIHHTTKLYASVFHHEFYTDSCLGSTFSPQPLFSEPSS